MPALRLLVAAVPTFSRVQTRFDAKRVGGVVSPFASPLSKPIGSTCVYRLHPPLYHRTRVRDRRAIRPEPVAFAMGLGSRNAAVPAMNRAAGGQHTAHSGNAGNIRPTSAPKIAVSRTTKKCRLRSIGDGAGKQSCGTVATSVAAATTYGSTVRFDSVDVDWPPTADIAKVDLRENATNHVANGIKYSSNL